MKVGLSIWEMVKGFFTEMEWFYVLLVVFAFCFIKAGKETRKKLILIIILSMVFVFNDIVKSLFESLFSNEGTFYRFLWMIPMTILIAYGIVLGFESCKGKVIKFIYVVVMVVCVYFVGFSWKNEWELIHPNNVYLILNDALSISQLIQNDTEEERITVAMPLRQQLEVRTYDPAIIPAINRNAYIDYFKNGSTQKYVYQDHLIEFCNYAVVRDEALLRKSILKRKADYLIIIKEDFSRELMEELSLEYIGSTDRLEVYRVNRKELRKKCRQDMKNQEKSQGDEN